MTPHDLIAAFDVLADAPDGVKRLRELVLSLAVRGKLVAQDPRDEAAGRVVGAARAWLEERAAGVRRGRWKPLPTVSAEEQPFDLPPGWAWARVNDTGNYVNGLAFKPSDWKESGLPIIRIQNLTDPTKPFNYATGDYPDDVIVRDGDLLVSWSATLEAFLWDRGIGVLNQHIFRVVPCDVLTTHRFLFWLLRQAIRDMAASDHAHGLVMAHINRGPFLNHVVGIPPLAEQRRIVARVDELMGLLDRLEAARTTRDAVRRAARNAALADLRDAPDAEAVEAAWSRIARQMDDLFAEPEDVAPLRQAVLQLAVRGRLTGDDVGGWAQTCLGDLLVDGPTNGWSPKAVDYPTPVKSLKLSATTRGYFDSEQYKYVDPSGGIDEGLWLEPGDLLIQRSNTPEYVGTAAVYGGPPRTFIYPDLMMRCRFAPSVDVDFIHVALSAPSLRAWVSGKASGTSKSMVKINQGTVRSIPLRLPPKAKQIEIVEAVRRLHDLCDRMEARLTASRDLQVQFASAAVHHLDV